MGRPALQALAKRHGIKANRKSEAIISELRPLIAAGDICESAFSDLIRFEDESAYNPPDVKEASGPSAEPLTKGKSESASESQESSDVARLEPSISKHPESERSLANTNAMEQSGSADAQPSLELVRSSEAGARSSKAVAAVPSSGTAHPSVNDASASPAVKQRPKSYVKGAHSAKKVKKEAPLPRVASLTQSPAPKSVVSTGSNDRFKEMYQVRSGPSATSYNAAFKSTFASSAMPFNSGIPDRFAGHDSRYRKVRRQLSNTFHHSALSQRDLAHRACVSPPPPSMTLRSTVLSLWTRTYRCPMWRRSLLVLRSQVCSRLMSVLQVQTLSIRFRRRQRPRHTTPREANPLARARSWSLHSISLRRRGSQGSSPSTARPTRQHRPRIILRMR